MFLVAFVQIVLQFQIYDYGVAYLEKRKDIF